MTALDRTDDRLDAVVGDIRDELRGLRSDFSAEIRGLRSDMTHEMSAMRSDFSASQDRLSQIGFGLVAALLTALAALAATLV